MIRLPQSDDKLSNGSSKLIRGKNQLLMVCMAGGTMHSPLCHVGLVGKRNMYVMRNGPQEILAGL